MSEKGFRIVIPVHIKRDRRARKVLAKDDSLTAQESVPRIARLLALAHKWEVMVRRGTTTHTELARWHRLSGARVSQICDLALLAPEIQGGILDPEADDRSLTTRMLRTVAVCPIWADQTLVVRPQY